ncbi:MAG: helix-turn-helix domain-containing protein [Nitrospiraceae bacterium]|nr:helix-turn-helix domain-containing protein [Nitrospiraceae bacterium]
MLREKVEELERSEILTALRQTRWCKAKAARMLGLSERMFSYRLKKYGISIRKEIMEGGMTGRDKGPESGSGL